MKVRAHRTTTMETPITALLIFCDEPELQLFPIRHLFSKLKDHSACEEGHDRVSSAVISHSSIWWIKQIPPDSQPFIFEF